MSRAPARASEDLPTKVELKIVRIGNSRGVRIPKAVLERYGLKEALILEAREEGLLLRARKDDRMTWAETFKDMARQREDWGDLEAAVADGLAGDGW